MFLPDNESGKSGTLCEGSRPIRLAGSTLGHRAHICAFFNSAQEAYQVLLPYIKEGLERGEKAVHTINPRLRDEHICSWHQAELILSPRVRTANSSCVIGRIRI